MFSSRFLSCFLAAASALLMPAARSHAQTSSAAELRSPDQARKPDDVYRKWLTEDVNYIIAAEEVRAFQELSTDKARDRFIEAFWAKRNPLPGTSHNSFKEEHYRRIAYANEHYATASFPGWHTDRGKIYILYGRPDQIESHPTGEKSERTGGDETLTHPFEVWRYRHIDGLGDDVSFTLVDFCNCGDYKIEHPRK